MGQWIPWLPQYAVNVPEIDQQHKEMFRMFNQLLDIAWDGEGKDAIEESIRFLAAYVVNHFATEETFMQQHEFPDYVEHKKSHDEFTADVNYFLNEYGKKQISTELLVSVLITLGDWTREHIRGMDQELSRFLVGTYAPVAIENMREQTSAGL
jgi:hemerythrin